MYNTDSSEDRWIKSYVSMEKHWVGKDLFYRMAWETLLKMAAWKDCKVVVGHELVELKRGQILCSTRKLCSSWAYSLFGGNETKPSPRTVNNVLKLFEKDGMITRINTKMYTVLTICNYSKYQDVNRGSDNTSDNTPDNTSDNTSDNTPDNTSDNTLIEYIEYIERKEIKERKESVEGIEVTEGLENKNKHTDVCFSESTESKKTVIPKKTEEPPIDYNWVINEWNTICTDFPSINIITNKRKEKIRARAREMGGWSNAMPMIDALFRKAQSSDFLTGRDGKWDKCSFDWIFANGTNWVKIYEGNYDNRTNYQSYGRTDQNVRTDEDAAQRRRTEAFALHIAQKLAGAPMHGNLPDTGQADVPF